jgi:hypothetical protein
MVRLKAISFGVLVGFCLSGCGNGGLCATTQSATILVRDLRTELPAPKAIVALLPAPVSQIGNDLQDQVGWSEDTTDAVGKVTFSLFAFDDCAGLLVPKPTDWLSGSDYYVRVRGESEEETVRVIMLPGKMVSGRIFTVEVVAIGKPEQDPQRLD